VCLDLPGHGISDHRAPDAFQHVFDYVPQIFAAADALGWERFALVGHSMGGGIATLAAGARPERVTRLIAIEGLGPLSAPPEEAPERMARYIEEHGAWARGRAPRAYATRDEAIAARMAHPQAPLTREAAATLAARGLRQDADGFRWRHDPRVRITSMLRLTEEHVRAFFGRIRCPVLALIANQGWAFDREAERARLALLREARAVHLPGDHHIHLTAPALVADEISAFLLGRDAA
jgi:pimeloyl-ACP methyl ester carboxylesterase